MKRFLLTLLVLSCSLSAICENSLEHNKRHPLDNGKTNGLGIGGTVIWTWGFMYRRHFDNNLGFSTSIGGWLTPRGGHVGNELGLLYTVAHHHFSWASLPHSSIRVYLAGYLANIFGRGGYDYHNDSLGRYLDIGLGAGPGMEYFFNRNFALHLELPWMVFGRIVHNSFSFKDSYPHFGGGFVYYF